MIASAFDWTITIPFRFVFFMLDTFVNTHEPVVIIPMGIFIVYGVISTIDEIFKKFSSDVFIRSKRYAVLSGLLLAYIIISGGIAISFYETVSYVRHTEQNEGIEI